MSEPLLVIEDLVDVSRIVTGKLHLRFDPVEAHTLIDAPHAAEIADELRGRLEEWMRATGDPLLDGPVPAPEGAELNSPDQVSPAEPADGHVLDPAGSVH